MSLLVKVLCVLHFVALVSALPRNHHYYVACREVVYDHYLLALTWPN